MAHAMFARQSAFKFVAPLFRDRGWRVVTFDFRGHGKSACSDFGYDDFVERDLPAVVECVRARNERGPVALLGHSLGGHVALAAQGCGLVSLDALVLVAGANLWLRDFEPNAAIWSAKRAIMRRVLRARRAVSENFRRAAAHRKRRRIARIRRRPRAIHDRRTLVQPRRPTKLSVRAHRNHHSDFFDRERRRSHQRASRVRRADGLAVPRPASRRSRHEERRRLARARSRRLLTSTARAAR